MGLWYPEIQNRLGSNAADDSMTVCQVIDASIDQMQANATNKVSKQLISRPYILYISSSIHIADLRRPHKYQELYRHHYLWIGPNSWLYLDGSCYKHDWSQGLDFNWINSSWSLCNSIDLYKGRGGHSGLLLLVSGTTGTLCLHSEWSSRRFGANPSARKGGVHLPDAGTHGKCFR